MNELPANLNLSQSRRASREFTAGVSRCGRIGGSLCAAGRMVILVYDITLTRVICVENKGQEAARWVQSLSVSIGSGELKA